MEITKQDIDKAHQLIKPFIHRTPVITSTYLNELTGVNLFFKCENFQKIGAFKIRGAMNATLSLANVKLANGIATHSSGNHAQAIAFAAKVKGIKAYVVMPNNSPKIKVNAVNDYGALITFCEPNQQAREDALHEIVIRTGAEFIHPYDDYRVITGQATCAKELIEDFPNLNAVIAPVGGGGLLAGTCLAAHYFSANTDVYAGEPEGAADAILSLKSGKVEEAPYVNTIADGLLTKLGDKNLPILKEHVKQIYLVSEEEIKQTLRLVYERLKIVVEPSCVVPLAALIKNKEHFKGKNVGIIFTGGNVDLAKFGEWFV